MSTYTKDTKEPGQEIYFLNDDNIAFDKNAISCDAGFNAIASQKEFVETYGEFKQVSSDFYNLSDSVETSAGNLYGRIEGVSAAVEAGFLPLSGGAIDHLSVANGLTARGLIDTDYIKTNSTGDITVTGANGHGSFSFDFEGGINSISVNGASLSSYIGESINSLDADTVVAGQGKIVHEVRQRNGIISVSLRDLVSADIPALPISKIDRLEDDYATKQYTLGRIGETAIQYDDDSRRIWVINPAAGLSSWIAADRFIKDGVVDSVTHEAGDAGHPVDEGPYIVITWNTDAGKTQTWLKLREFASIYSSDDPGIKVGVGGDKFKLALDYNVVAKQNVVSRLVEYVTELSTPVTGIIDMLSAGVDSALSSSAFTVKFFGHITLYADETRRSVVQILEDEQLFDEHRRVKNGSMYQVTYLNSSGNPVESEARYETTDGLTLGNGDYIYIHKHGLDSYVKAEEITHVGGDRTLYLANPVHRYDIAELRQFVSDNFVKLSGNNDISGDNKFRGNLSVEGSVDISSDATVFGGFNVKGASDFEQAISVDFDELYDRSTGNTVNGIFATLSNRCTIVSSLTDQRIPEEKNNGDVIVVSSLIAESSSGDKAISRTAYYWNDGWIALDGNYSLSNVYFNTNMTFTEKFGHYDVPSNGYYVLDTKGKNLYDVLNDAFKQAAHGEAKKPTFSLTVNGNTNEVGASYTVPAATLKMDTAGSYPTYGPADTGISVLIGNAFVKSEDYPELSSRNTQPLRAGMSIATGSGDVKYYVDGATTYNYQASAEWTQGVVPKNNLGEDDPENRISAGISSLTKSISFTGYRQGFYGYRMASEPQLDFNSLNSDDIRLSIHTSSDLYGKRWNATAGLWPTKFTVPAGSKQIIFAVPENAKDFNTHKYIKMSNVAIGTYYFENNGLLRDVDLSVNGAKTGTELKYYVWTINPEGAFGSTTDYTIEYSSSKIQ